MVGIAASFISTFFAHGFLTLAKQAIWQVCCAVLCSLQFGCHSRGAHGRRGVVVLPGPGGRGCETDAAEHHPTGAGQLTGCSRRAAAGRSLCDSLWV
jgi:hypothetical protein